MAQLVAPAGHSHRGNPRSLEQSALRYTLADCTLGRLLLAASERGVCALFFGDSDAVLEAELSQRFGDQACRRDDAVLAEMAGAIRDHLRGAHPQLDLPLDVRGTPFQEKVWEQLRLIPTGQTRTYRQIAESIGRPRAARAVAGACAANPVSLLIPCHRVVRGDGSLCGYRWDPSRKHRLLVHEGAVESTPGQQLHLVRG